MENINCHLQKAVKQNNLQSAHVARGMLVAVENFRKEEEAKEKEILKLSKEIDQKEKKVLNNLLQSRLSKVQINCDKEILSTNSQLASKSQSKIKKSVIKNATNVRETSESETLSSKPKARKRKTDNKKTVVPEKKQKVIQNKRIDNFLKTNQENKGIVFIPHDSERVIKKKF